MVDNDNFEKIVEIFNKVCYCVAALMCLAVTFLFIYFSIKADSLAFSIVLCPFILAFFFAAGQIMSAVFDSDKYQKIFAKSYFVAGLLFWIGFIAYATYSLIVDQNYRTLVVLVPVYSIGGFVLFKLLKKKLNGK